MPAASIEHGFFSAETLHRLQDSGSVWIPTVFALAHLEEGLSADQRLVRDRIIDRHLESIVYAVSIGVKLRVGTDSGAAGVLPGISFFEELRLLKQAGLSPDQILEAACMEAEAVEPDSFLLIGEDFIERGAIEGAFIRGQPLG